MKLTDWELQFESKISEVASSDDPAHDMLHFKRVVGLAKYLCEREKGNAEIVVPAAWLHDLVIVPKDSPLRSQASRLSAEKAIEFLKSINYPAKFYNEIAHAVEGHSFSANIEVKTIEAKIVQDADRLDGLGAIGIARCFATAGLLKRAFYNSEIHSVMCERLTKAKEYKSPFELITEVSSHKISSKVLLCYVVLGHNILFSGKINAVFI